MKQLHIFPSFYFPNNLHIPYILLIETLVVRMEFTEMSWAYRLLLYHGLVYPLPNSLNGKFAFIGQFIRNVIFFLPWFGLVAAVYQEGFRESMNGTAFYVFIGLITNSHLLFYYKKKDQTFFIINTLEGMLTNRKESWEKQFFNFHVGNIWKVVKVFNIIMFMFTLVFLCIIPIMDIVFDYYGLTQIKVPLPFQGFSKRTMSKINVHLLEIAGIIWCWFGISNYISTQCAFLIFNFYAAVEIKLLCEKVRLLSFCNDDRFKVKLSSNKSISNDGITLRAIIIHHQFILRLCNQLILYFGLPFAIQNKISSLCICLTLITTLFAFNSDRVVALTSAVSCICVILQLFGICFVGNYLKDQSEMISHSLYHLPWYRLSPNTRKTLNMMFMQAAKPININYRGLSSVTLSTFMQIINAAYSYFTLLKSVMDD